MFTFRVNGIIQNNSKPKFQINAGDLLGNCERRSPPLRNSPSVSPIAIAISLITAPGGQTRLYQTCQISATKHFTYCIIILGSSKELLLLLLMLLKHATVGRDSQLFRLVCLHIRSYSV